MITQTHMNESLYFPLHLPTPPPDASRLPREMHPAEMLLLRFFKSSLVVSSFESILDVSPCSPCWRSLKDSAPPPWKSPSIEQKMWPTASSRFPVLPPMADCCGLLGHHTIIHLILRSSVDDTVDIVVIEMNEWVVTGCVTQDVHQSPKWDCQTRKLL